MYNKGWIAIYRCIQDSWFWNDDKEKFDKAHAFVDMLLTANHAEKTISLDGNPHIIKRGQFHTSILKLSERWGWNRKTVTKFLQNLEKTETISYETNQLGTTITLLNYDKYQCTRDNSMTSESNNDMVTTTHSKLDINTDTNNNDKKKISEKENKYSDSFELFWKNYPRKIAKEEAFMAFLACQQDGFTSQELAAAGANYAEDCINNNREEKYIKYAANFLGKGQPFTDYLPNNYSPTKKIMSKSQFHNFDQRNYDYEILEKITGLR